MVFFVNLSAIAPILKTGAEEAQYYYSFAVNERSLRLKLLRLESVKCDGRGRVY
jgi:hypothetical protein